MSVLLHVAQAAFAIMALGIMLSYPKFRQPELVVGAITYAVAAGVSFARNQWWPLIAGFGVAWLILIIVGDRSQPGHSRFNIRQFLARAARENEKQQRNIGRAAADPRIIRVLSANGRSENDLSLIRAELADSGVGESADRVIADPGLLEEYFSMHGAALPDGWTEADRKLRIATLLRERLGI